MSNANNTSKGPGMPFKLPTRAELEERRKQLEANSKPAILFKPTGIVIDSSSSTSKESVLDNDATNSASYSSSSTSTAHTATTTTSNQRPDASSIAPAIVSSRQLYQQQQQQKAQAVAEDDDFGFGDDLGDVNFNDDLFDEIDKPSSSKLPTATQSTQATLVATQPYTQVSSSPTQASTATAIITPAAGKSLITPPFQPKSKSTIVVRSSQRGNPLLQFIRNVPYEYGDVIPDFVVGLTSCVLFLSIRYHRLHPEYVFSRIASLGNNFVLRVLLVLVDVDTHQHAIRELTRVAMVNDLTLICAWSNEEAARYIETYKAYENKAPDAIKERVENDYLSKLTDGLTQIPTINKTDIITLSSTFGSLKNIMDASADELGLLPGFGERKVKRLLEAFDQPFAIDPKKRRHKRS
ncbi:ssDNA endonuclease and repair protein rad10 [Linnemannia zychae]|nr:ssDNA endonuclease and repair protein rad10 [Linnemannia zychae]